MNNKVKEECTWCSEEAVTTVTNENDQFPACLKHKLELGEEDIKPVNTVFDRLWNGSPYYQAEVINLMQSL